MCDIEKINMRYGRKLERDKITKIINGKIDHFDKFDVNTMTTVFEVQDMLRSIIKKIED